MSIKALIFIPFVFLCVFTHAQQLGCQKLIKKIEADSNNEELMWAHDEFTLDDYYCAGKYFAQHDIEKGIYLIQYSSNEEQANPCRICNYKQYGFSFEYHWHGDIVFGTTEKFIEGYNEISKAFLKAKVGDSIFQYLETIPNEYFNPNKILNNVFAKNKYSKYFDIERINNKTINVKINIDSLFKGYPALIEKTICHITPNYNRNSKHNLPAQTFNYKQIKEVGFRLIQQGKDKYIFKVDFDFSNIKRKEEYCWCAPSDKKKYNFIIPLIIKN